MNAPFANRTETVDTQVLVVDDEPIVARLIKNMLKPWADVTICEDIQGAIAHLQGTSTVDLVLCDLSLRAGSGSTLHRWMEQNRPDLLPRIAFVTGGPCTREAQHFLDETRPPCLLKPFTRSELLEFAGAFLENRARPH